MSLFSLEKWYLDAVDEQGRAFIGYHARIRWKRIRLVYSGFIYQDGADAFQKNSFRARSEIGVGNDHLKLTNRLAEASLKSAAGPVKELLLENEHGHIRWNCLFPKAEAVVSVKGKADIRGNGYAEKLSMSLPPWELPIEELRWGRYLSKAAYITWIKWTGPVERNLVYFNGQRFTGADISDTHVAFDRFRLDIRENRELRSGSLSSTVFAGLKRLMRYFPFSVLHSKETKWLGKGSLSSPGSVTDSGFVIHEKVTWA